jgi:biotin-dependent carboxylase-like uncharacterized protein
MSWSRRVKPALRVLTPGLCTTIQDLGRPGYQKLGVPVSGALDPVSLRAANALAGNAPSVAALEVAYVGPALVVEADSVRLSFVGAQAPIDIFPNETSDTGTRITGLRSVMLHRGQVIRVGSLSSGMVLYVAVEGGFDIPPTLGSVSTCLRGALGGWQGRTLITGDALPLCRNQANERSEVRLEGFELRAPARFRTVDGPQRHYFSDREAASFFDSEYTICPSSDRMGMRLSGPAITHAGSFNITSDAIAPGSIQIPGNGQPIVLLADRQTTGGYPKLATVISADVPALGRLSIGAKIRFEPVSIETAVAARRKMIDDIERIGEKVMPLRRTGSEITAKLLESNLISGFVDAAA